MAACLDCNVLNEKLLSSTSTGLAAVFPEPGVLCLPVAYLESHATGQVWSDFCGTGCIHVNGFSSLCQRSLEFSVILKSDFDVEFQGCVDCERAAWAISIVGELSGGVNPAVSTTVAVGVETISIWRITRVWRGLEGPLVGLHNIKLRAEVSAHLIGVTVVVAICIPGISIYVFAWSLEKIKGSNAATVAKAQVDVVIDTSAKQVWLVKMIGINRW